MAIRKTLLSSLSLLLLSSLTPVLAADTFSFLPSAASSTFPECGLTCTLLQQAQTACVPPSAPVSSDTTYVNCFCSSSYLLGLKSSGAVCSTCTSYSDQQLLVAWYNGYCNGGYKSTLTSTSTTSASTGSSTTSATSAATTTAGSGSSSDSVSTSSSGQGWWSGHWQWILMLIILIIGFTLLAFGGIWLKKRLDAKQPGLYHGDDRNNSSSRENRSPAAAFMIPTSLRNFSSRNSMNNTASTTTPNNASVARNINNNNNNNGSHSIKNNDNVYVQQHPNMSMTSLSNNRPEMWGPHQATAHIRDLDDITPVDDAAFGAGGGGGVNGSRTDISSIGTGRQNPRLSVNSAANLHRAEPVSPVSPIQ